MFLWQLAWRNLWRYPKRTWLTILALSLTTLTLVFLLSFQMGTYETMKQQSLRLMDGYAQIQAPDYLQKPNIRRSFFLSSGLIQDLKQLKQRYPELIWSPRAQTFGLLSLGEQNSAGMLWAVDPMTEVEMTRLQTKIVKGRYLETDDQNRIVIGQALAKQLKAELGDQIQVLSSDKQGSVAADLLEVVGIFDSGIEELNRQLIVMPLSYFQTLFVMPNQAHQLAFLMPTLAQLEAISPQLQAIAQKHHLVLQDGRALEPGLYNGIDLDFFSGMVWYIAILLIVVLILLNTLLMSLLEREREFGLMLSLGLSHRQLATLVNLETQLTLLLGNGLGIVLGVVTTAYFMETGILIPGTEEVYAAYGLEATLYPDLTGFSVFFAPGILWLGGVLMGVVLSARLYRLTPLSGRQMI